MKAKLLLAPLLIIVTIVLCIWLVYPAYTNGVDGFKEKRAVLAEEQQKLATISNKMDNASKLSSQLASDKESSDILFAFVPEQSKEEEIIDNLNFLANSEGLNIEQLSVGLPTTPVVAPAAAPAEVPATGAATPETPVATPPPAASEMTVSYSVTGSYSKIKDILSKVYGFERFDKVASLDIQSNSTTEKSSGDNLRANMALTFNFLKKSTAAVSVDDPVFSISSFDSKIIASIKERKQASILKLNVEQSGRANPFLP